MADRNVSPTVQFPEDLSEKPLLKHVPTQKYNRKEIQKRLDIETWMEEQLRELFETDDYPQLDIDDVLKIEQDLRETKLREYLKTAKQPIDGFIKELIEKAATVKPV